MHHTVLVGCALFCDFTELRNTLRNNMYLPLTLTKYTISPARPFHTVHGAMYGVCRIPAANRLSWGSTAHEKQKRSLTA